MRVNWLRVKRFPGTEAHLTRTLSFFDTPITAGDSERPDLFGYSMDTARGSDSARVRETWQDLLALSKSHSCCSLRCYRNLSLRWSYSSCWRNSNSESCCWPVS